MVARGAGVVALDDEIGDSVAILVLDLARAQDVFRPLEEPDEVPAGGVGQRCEEKREQEENGRQQQVQGD